MTSAECRDLLICGTHSFAEEAYDLVSEMPDWRVVGFVENWDRGRAGGTIEGLPVHWIDDLAGTGDVWAFCAIGSTKRVEFTRQVDAAGVPFATLVHPKARVSPRASLGEGTLVSSGVQISTRTTIGRHVILNRGALVGHHTRVGDHVSIMPGANVAGNITIGDRAFIGMGALVLDGRTVGERAVVGAGAVVTRDVPDGVQVVGAPARVTGEVPDGR